MVPKKEITIYDLALKLNISPATVSRGLKDHPAINKATKKKIIDLAQKIGYRSNNFARNLRQQKTNTIGVIVPRLNSNFTSTVIAGMESIISKAGYTLIISQSSELFKNEIISAKTMFNNRVDGLLVSLAYDTENIKHFDEFVDKNIPVIFFDRVIENENCTVIVIDNKKAAFDATSHLIKQGCKRIVHITAPHVRSVYLDRLNGYKEALAENKISFKPEYIIKSNLSQEGGADAANLIAKMKPLPEAVFAANDITAIGCMIAMNKTGIRIPDDIAFVGFNNDPVSNVVTPNLTTVNYPAYEMGCSAAQSLIAHLDGVSNIKTTNTIVIRSQLLIRESSLKAAISIK